MAFSRPHSCGRNWWDSWDYPISTYDQHFGTGLIDSDLFSPAMHRDYLRPRTRAAVEASGLKYGICPECMRALSGLAEACGLLDSDLFPPVMNRDYLRPRTRAAVEASGIKSGICPDCIRDLPGLSEVKNKKDKFQVMLNVSHFKPNEVEVKVVDKYIVIHGKHEEKADEHGLIQREFTRRLRLPEGVETETVKSSWIPSGVLKIEGAKKAIEAPPSNERVIPITMSSFTNEEKKGVKDFF